ncbi:MAG: Outer membrane lipoprotein Omp16 [Alphaproteobacteria bacterium MarineAlpha2_Bin1]|nr:MAG: Outer membrane lipoprotein Omp16 [Alphaproteobacteria bacterium MarineAlpha2_Bin1]
MRLKFIMAIAALFVVSACTTVTDTDSGAGGSGESTKSSSSSSVESSQEQSKSAEILPGSQADLVSNVGDRVLFEYDSSDLTPEARRTLERQAAWLKRYSNVSVTIEGHCDERGTREYNLALGERRATAVSNFLVALGINGARIMTISYGKEKPVALGSNDTAWSQNRRGVTRVRAQ